MAPGFVITTAHGQLRRQLAAYLALGVLVALGGGAALGAAIASDRTDGAYDDYVKHSEVSKLVINPSVSSVAMTDAIRGFDGVEGVYSSSLLGALIGDVESGVLGELSDQAPWLQVVGSPDGRFVEVDRPAVTSGRLPTGDHELFVSNEERPVLEAAVGRPLAVGDTVQLSFYWTGLFNGDVDYSATVSSIGVESLQISGFGVLPDEVLPDELYPRQRLIVSGDIARKYGCTADYRGNMTDEEASAAAFPPNCSTLYQYYSLQLDGNPNTAASIRQQFGDAAERLTPDLPQYIAQQRAGYYFISQDRADIDLAVARAIRPTVAALDLFSIVTLLATVAIFGVAVARVARRAETESRRLMELGATTAQRVIATALPAAAAIAIGILGAVAIGALLSPIGPVGSVRVLVNSPGIGVPLRLVLATVVPLAVALAAMASVVAFAMARRTARANVRASRKVTRLTRLVSAWRRPSFTTGTSAALDVSRPGTAAAIVGCVIAVACVSGALIFDSNVKDLVDKPVEYGWPWDVAVVVGAGYSGAEPDTVAQALANNSDVDSYELYGMDPSTQIGGQGVSVLYGFSNFDPPKFPIVSGRAARHGNEAVLGSKTAESLGVEVGDEISLQSTRFVAGDVVVVGIAVLPSIGPFIADRTGLGDGVFVILDQPVDDSSALVAINLRDGVAPTAFVEGIADVVPSWDGYTDAPLVLTKPVRSAEIINVSDLRLTPLLLIRLLGLALFSGFALSIIVSVRDRQRELAILRVLGFRDAELRASVRWQASMMMIVGLIFGVPVGVVLGRTAWRAFATQLGVVPRASIPISVVAVTIAGSLVLAILAAIVPARSATRTKSGLALRR
ncbi:hypothetical protein BH10ACT2_BH10ACT2_20530 [soil metagenome]